MVSLGFVFASQVVSYNAGYNFTNTNITQESSGFFYLNVSDANLKLYFPFDVANTSTTIYDYTNQSNDGTLYNGINWSSSGYFGGAYEFDGVNDYIKTGSGLNLGNMSFTFSTWIKFNTKAGVEEGIFAGHGTNLFLRYNVDGSANQIKVQMYNGTTFSLGGTGAIDLYDDAWHHLVWVVNKSYGQRIYVDNANIGNITTLPPNDIPNLANYYLGTRALTVGTYFNGSMDEVMIFNRSLSEQEIAQIYNSSYSRFYPTGEMLFENLDFPENTTNITLDDCQTLSESYIQAKINLGSYVNFSSCSITDYNISGTLTNSNLIIKMVAGDNFFYTPNIADINATGNPGLFKLNYSLYLENNSFINSDGLRIYYDVYMNLSGGTRAPIYVISDTWSANRATMRTEAQTWKDRGYFSINLETRGKGNSEGTKDASGWECLDIYEAVNNATSVWGDYVNTSRIYLNGFSGAGGKTLNCIGKMPDFFTAVQGVASTSNYTLWAQLNSGNANEIYTRVGDNYTNDPEAYKSRNGAWAAYNVVSPILIHHNDGDSVVNVTLSRNYNETVYAYNKTNVTYVEEVGSAHSFTISSRNQAVSWFDSHQNPVNLSTSGDLRIGTFIRTKLFDVDLSLGKVGTVEYDFSASSNFEMNFSTETFTGPVNVTVKDFLNDTRFV